MSEPLLRLEGREPLGALRVIAVLSLVVPAGVVVSIWGSRLGQGAPGRSLLGWLPREHQGTIVVAAAFAAFVGFWLATLAFLRDPGRAALFEEALHLGSARISWDEVLAFDDAHPHCVVLLLRKGKRALWTRTEAERVALLALLDRMQGFSNALERLGFTPLEDD